MTCKKTNIEVHVNSQLLKKTLKILLLILPYIFLIRICVQEYDDFLFEKIANLKALSLEYNFMILQDSKFADSTQTVKTRYTQGFYRIANWADFITVHFVEGVDILNYLKIAASESNINDARGAFVITQPLDLLNPNYTTAVLNGIEYRSNDFLAGIIHVSDMPTVNKRLIKLAAEEIPLNENIQKIQNNLTELIKEKKTDICFLKISDNVREDFQKIPQLQSFCWESYNQLK